MEWFFKLSLAAIMVFIIWRSFRLLKENPQLLSKAALSKSFRTLGVLALLLIAFIMLLSLFLK